MRILWLSHLVPYPPSTGAMQRSFHLLRAAAAAHEVTLLAFNQARLLGSAEELEAARDALARICARVVVHPIPADASPLARLRVVLRGARSSHPYVALWLDSAPFRRDLAALLEGVPFDLVHVDTLGLAPHVPSASPLPVVLDHHNVESHLMARRAARERHPLRRWYFRREAAKLAAAERRHAARAAVNLVVSELDGARLREAAGDVRIALCPNGTDPDYFAPRPVAPEPGHLLFVGSLAWYPNRQGLGFFLREVWPRLTGRRPSVRLTVVGADPFPDLLRAARADDRIRVAGRVDDVRPYYERAAVVVCPVLDGGGTRLKVLEAMAMARPVVSTSLGCEGLALEAGRHYLRADTPEEFAAQIGRLLDDPGLARRLGEAGRVHVLACYAWPAIARRLLDVYAEAAGRRGAAAGRAALALR
ncbi:MAG TPA: glycosyltransferase [Thermodesulfobacteriota bacterium]|nr:glycosyltransferase [Thermodesulfobacteriota bacterium]